MFEYRCSMYCFVASKHQDLSWGSCLNDQGVIFTSNFIKVNYINRTCENMKNMEMFQLMIEGGREWGGRREKAIIPIGNISVHWMRKNDKIQGKTLCCTNSLCFILIKNQHSLLTGKTTARLRREGGIKWMHTSQSYPPCFPCVMPWTENWTNSQSFEWRCSI